MAAADCNASDWPVSHYIAPMTNPPPTAMQPIVKILWPLVKFTVFCWCKPASFMFICVALDGRQTKRAFSLFL